MVETQSGKGIAGGMCASEIGPAVLVYIEVEDPQAYLDRIEAARSEEHTSELQSLMRTSYAVFCLKIKKSTHRKITILNRTKNKHYISNITSHNTTTTSIL